MQNVKESYRDKGYHLFHNVVPSEKRTALYHALVRNYGKFAGHDSSSLLAQEAWTNASINEELKALRAADPMLFGGLYDTMQNTNSLFHLIMGGRIEELALELLQEDASGVVMTGQMLRMDPPHDDRNSLTWHQESSYYPYNDSGEKGLVCWIPMHDINVELGTIMVCPHSHQEGLTPVESSGKADAHTSEQFAIPAEKIAAYPAISVEVSAGDALFFNMDLYHRSGDNRSQSFRFAAGARFSRSTTADYAPGQRNAKLRKYIRSKMKETVLA